MARKDLTPNDHAKLGLAMAAKRAQPLQVDGYGSEPVTFILDLALYDETEVLDILEILRQKQWIDGFVKLPKLDADGYAMDGYGYISGLSTAESVRDADGYHGLRSALVVEALHWNDYPDWAKLPDGNPAHRWAGIQIQGGPIVRPMRKRTPPIPIINPPE